MKDKKTSLKQKYQYIGVRSKSVRLKENNLWGMNDLEGLEILPINFLEVFTLPSDFGLVAAREAGSWKLFDLKGNPVSDEEYDEIYPFYGLFSISKVRIGKKWGLINKYGQEVSALSYKTIKRFGKGLYLEDFNSVIQFLDNIQLRQLNEITTKIEINFAEEKIATAKSKIKIKGIKTK